MQQVILCDSGQQAVDKAKQLQMDLILMDIQMPDMDGIRACAVSYTHLWVIKPTISSPGIGWQQRAIWCIRLPTPSTTCLLYTSRGV